jgi:YVTN family beta-propeller protein
MLRSIGTALHTVWRPALLTSCLAWSAAAAASELRHTETIPLGDVAGRIDHLAVDVVRKRLFVAELGSDRVAVVDLDARRVLQTIDALAEPQGVAYEPTTDTLFVANGGDGSVRLYSGGGYAPVGRVDLHDDADNVRLDAVNHRVLVGYGHGLAAIDIATHAMRAWPLGGHPESFQIEATGRVFVNVPSVRAVVTLEADGRAQQRSIAPPGANFPLALDDLGQLVLPLRRPPALLVMLVAPPPNTARDPASSAQNASTSRTDRDSTSGTEREPTSSELCDDADDVFFDAARKRLYVSCGDGHLDVFERTDSRYARVDHVPTAHGARTSLFVADWDRLYLAVPASAGTPAAVWIMEPN